MARQPTLTFTPDIPPTEDQIEYLWRNGGLDALAAAITNSIRRDLAEGRQELQVEAVGDIMEVPMLVKEEALQ